MNYYFDESGAWLDIPSEKKGFIMTGVVVTKPRIFDNEYRENIKNIWISSQYKRNEIENEITTRTGKTKVIEFHATEMRNNGLKEELGLMLDQISKAIQNEVIKVEVLRKKPVEVQGERRTHNNDESVYISNATNLLAKLALGDNKPVIYHDPIFGGGYPLRVAQVLEDKGKTVFSAGSKIDDEFRTLMNACELNEKAEQIQSDVIQELKKAYAKINACNDREEQNRKIIGNLMDYLQKHDNGYRRLCCYKFMQFWLDLMEQDRTRESYARELTDKLRTMRREVGLKGALNFDKILFVNKKKVLNEKKPENFGVFVADAICNSFWQKIKKSGLLSAEERLCKLCKVSGGEV